MNNSKRKKPVQSGKKSNLEFSSLTLHKLNWLEWITIILSGWFLFYPYPYDLLLGVLLMIPILGMVLNGLERPSVASLVEITVDHNGERKYDVADFIDIAAWVVLIRVIMDFEFESFYTMVIPGTVAFVLSLAILFITHKLIQKSTGNRWWIYTSIIFNICLYSYAGTYAANCTYDYSEPVVYKTRVLDKSVTSSKGRRTYRIKVAPWGNHLEKEKITVSMEQYAELQIGDSVNMDLKKGLFNIPWYYIERK